MKNVKALVAVAAAAALLTGCGFESGEVGVVQNGSFFPGADKNLIGCIAPESTEQHMWDKVYWYPARQISWDASGGEGAERAPYKVVSNARSAAEVNVPVVVTADLTTDCEALQNFHREQGTKYTAWMVQGEPRQTSDGWFSLLNYVIGQPTETTLTRIAQKYTWQEIWNDDAIRVEFEQALQEELPRAIKKRTGGDYFTNINVTVMKPDPVNPDLTKAIEAKQAALTEAESKRETANANVDTAKAETELAQEKAKQQAAEIEGYPSVEDYLRARLIEKGGNPYQPTFLYPGAPK